MKDSGAVDDYASGSISGGTHWKSGNAKNAVKDEARAQLEMLRAALISQSQSILGDKYIASDIETMIDQVITETVDSYNYQHKSVGIFGARDKYSFAANELYDQFFDNFDEKLDKYKQDKQ